MRKISTPLQRAFSKSSLNWKSISIGVLASVIFIVALGGFTLLTSKPRVAAWKTFRSSREIGISFEYPSDWYTVKSAGSNIPVLIPADENAIGISIYCHAESSEKIIAWLASHEDLVISERISIQGNTARKIHTQGRGGGERLELLIKGVECSGQKQTLRLTMFSNQTISPKHKNDFEHIISTFKFLD